MMDEESMRRRRGPHDEKKRSSLAVARRDERESSSVGTPVPSSPSPARGKRPQLSQEVRQPLKKVKFEKELTVHALLPNGTSYRFKGDGALINSVKGLKSLVRANAPDRENKASSRVVEWEKEVWLENEFGHKLTNDSLVKSVSAAKLFDTILIIVQDGHVDSSHVDTNLWNVTPKPEMLGQLPQGYTLQTALADQVDNALQAVWHNQKGSRRLVSVNLSRDKIVIFDTGQGMDGSSENCIANWGTVGGSTHRAVHHKGLGGEPPFLKPYLGKYGAGGVAAALHLGSRVTVWSKTRQSRKVVSLVLEQKALVEKHREDSHLRVWKEEQEMAPHGSFTRVEIQKLKAQYCLDDNKQYWRVETVRKLLKDIYFPYIQTETGSSSKTIFPVEFEVNGENLLEITECETAIFKVHTCTGAPFVFDLRLKIDQDEGMDRQGGASTEAVEEANARITCQYYPNQKGKESLDTVLEELTNLKGTTVMTFETMPRVTIRWLGRLLPEVKWPILPFMEVSQKKEQKLGLRRLWAKRVRAFIDTDAGFHPTQSKMELDRDKPFTVALERTGAEDFSGTTASGVIVSIKRDSKELSIAKLTDAYMDWLREMHANYDDDFAFVDQPVYIFNHPNALKELGVEKKQVILFHKHLKDSKGEWKVDDRNPLRIRLLKGAGGLKSEMYATIEYFFHDGAAEEHGEVKFLCRALEVDEVDGCKVVVPIGENAYFVLNKSQWFPAALLGTPKCQRLDMAAWKKKLEEISNKSPHFVEILNEGDCKKMDVELCKMFPADNSKFEAGFDLPKEFMVVVRPRKGSGSSWKQGMVVAEPMNLVLTVTHCSCSGICPEARASSGSSGNFSSGHRLLICVISDQSVVSKSGVKGLHSFTIGSSEANRLVKRGTYSFHIAVEGEKYTHVRPVVSSIHIVPSRVTAQWTLCNHSEDCRVTQHVDMLPISIRLNEQVQDLFIQKYDEYENRQTLETPIELEVMALTRQGESLDMQTKVLPYIIKTSPWRQRLQIKNLLFTNGDLERLDSTYAAQLRVAFPEGKHAELKCKVLPGPLATIKVMASKPLIPIGSFSFEEALQPGEIIRKLTLQGLDTCGNKIEKGQKMRVLLQGLEFQDSGPDEREVNEYGCLHLGGLLAVICHYNSGGSITIVSCTGSKLSTITFRTVTRQLVASQVPSNSYVGRYLEGISVKIVDALGIVDTTVDGYSHSIRMDWLSGVTCPFFKGECILPGFHLPDKPGCWIGKVSFSANANLNVTLKVVLELATACGLGPLTSNPEVLTAECGVPFVFPFKVLDDQSKPAVLTESMKNTLLFKVESKDTILRPIQVVCKDVTTSTSGDMSGYEARIVMSGHVGSYVVSLMDTSSTLKGNVESVCILHHGKIARLVPALSTGTHVEEYESSVSKALTSLQATRCSQMPSLIVTLLDSDGNVCSSCNGMKLRMKIQDCPQWSVSSTEVCNGIGLFESSLLVVPVRSYVVSIQLESSPEDLYSLDEPQGRPAVAQFSLDVKHGNYPSKLEYLGANPVSVSLTRETIQYLPRMSILVISADKLRLTSRPYVAVKLHGDISMTSGPAEYFGTFMDVRETEVDSNARLEDDLSTTEARVGSVAPVRYEFTQVCAPPKAGDYVMEFFIRDNDVTPISVPLVVKHGPPFKLEITQREQMQELCTLQVNVIDVHGNVCEDLSGLQMCLELTPIKTSDRMNSGALLSKSCALLSKSNTVVEHGKGDFGVFELSRGNSGIYALKVFAVHGAGAMNLQSLIPWEAQIVAGTNIPQTLHQLYTDSQSASQDYQECLKVLQATEKMIQQKRVSTMSLEEDIRKIEGELRGYEIRQNSLKEMREAAHDDEVLHAEQSLPLRSEQTVFHDIRLLANRNSAALALLEAQVPPNFLSANSTNPMAKDVLGLVVMLARVESDALNRILSEFLGLGSLLLIICRTQGGVRALEEYDARGELDQSKGLHGFARSKGYKIEGKYEVLSLMDTRPFYRNDRAPAVNTDHPQRILNIDPPLVNGQLPSGFLGYAVNLLHLKSEQLQMTVATRIQGMFGLRESLFYHLLGTLQVYDTRQHMFSAKEGMKYFHGGAISLDGGIILRNQRQQLGKRIERSSVRFSMVPSQERMVSSLLPPVSYAFQRLAKWNHINTHMRSKSDEQDVLRQRISTAVADLKHLEKNMATANTRKGPLLEASKKFCTQVSELMRAAKTLGERDVFPGMSMNSQDSHSERMRAYMI